MRRVKETEYNVRLAGAKAPVALRGGPQGSVEGIVAHEGPIRGPTPSNDDPLSHRLRPD